MPDISPLAKTIIMLGVFLIIFGGILLVAGKIPWLGRLPGDLFWQKGNFTFYFPLATSLIVSLILTLILNLFLRH